MLKKELDKCLESIGLYIEWMDVKRDLLALQELVLQEEKNPILAFRTAPQGCCFLIFKAVGVAIPKTIRKLA